MFSEQDKKFMLEALFLAAQGKDVFPNPMVGAVIVSEKGDIVGKGYHSVFGGHHAEIAAIENCRNKTLLKGATLYVTLEPCCHHGKTPPCVDEIVKNGIQRVVIAMTDPNPLVACKGVKTLQDSGISVETGLLEEKARTLNVEYIDYISSKKD